MSKGKLTGAAVAEHNSKDSCWVIVHGKAYDVTEFLPGTSSPVPQRVYVSLTVVLQNTPVAKRSFSSTPVKMRPRNSSPFTRPTP